MPTKRKRNNEVKVTINVSDDLLAAFANIVLAQSAQSSPLAGLQGLAMALPKPPSDAETAEKPKIGFSRD
jgi:hypothetical protein